MRSSHKQGENFKVFQIFESFFNVTSCIDISCPLVDVVIRSYLCVDVHYNLLLKCCKPANKWVVGFFKMSSHF